MLYFLVVCSITSNDKFLFLMISTFFQEQLSKVLDAMFERAAQPGDHIIDQGDDGDNFYVIDR